ncbi:3-dehydroquinate synthase [Candidatus Woesebacteria bacterium]|nr:3-dehydroquinate synthase [Candidatus Woesebacteria bacterium]
MMNNTSQKKITVSLRTHAQSYDIVVGAGICGMLSKLLNVREYSVVYIITDTNVGPLYLDKLQKELTHDHIHSFICNAGEQSKSLGTVQEIYEDMAHKRIDRKSLVINLGGGVVTDLGGFAASTFMRGIPFVNIATTLEGMVDASVGGKTGVNIGHLKNYVGTFSQPKMVIVDVEVLASLPDRAFVQGYAEVIKHGLISDKRLFEAAIQKSPTAMNGRELIDIISESVRIKSLIVMEDEYERAARKLLNFGHTIGHVLESLSFTTDHPLFHGEAVSIGMIAEAYISHVAGMLTAKEFAQIEAGIRSVGLPTRYAHKSTGDEVLSLLHSDKKNEHGTIKWTLLSGIGTGEFNVSISEKFVKDGIAYITH